MGKKGAPGGNVYAPENVQIIDDKLHLRLTHAANVWKCASVQTVSALSYGRYQWQIETPVNDLNENVVLGLFGYRGPDYTNEIDIEFSKWGVPLYPTNASYTCYPRIAGIPPKLKEFNFPGTAESTHRMVWKKGILQMYCAPGYHTLNDPLPLTWNLPWNQVPTSKMPIFMDLWLMNGIPPSDAKEVDIVIKEFVHYI